jgi:peptidoglycan/LPS O-acetylase OafA/YrhL
VELPHYPGLDGLRGIAVIAVVLFHGGVVWASGGFLGVEVFFVLSGFLITSLLVRERQEQGRIRLRAFWARRARRLLPALFVLVIVIGIYYAVAGPSAAVPGFWGDGLSALFYFSNWHQIAVGTSYFASSGPVSPFQHTWSLSIEEQFYVLWPLIVFGVFGFVVARGRSRSLVGPLRLLLAVTLAGLLAAAIEMGVLFNGGHGLDRVYYGTDTRATGLLAGAALALWLAIRRQEESGVLPSGRRTVALSRASGVLLGAVLLVMYLADGPSGWLYPYGFLLLDAATACLIAAVVLRPGTWANRVLRLPPLQAIGQISYGVYLWHFPLFLWLTTSSTGLSGAHLLMFRVGVTFLVSAASYVFVEQPIRRRRLPVIQVRRLAPIAAATALAAVFLGSSVSALPTGLPAAAKLPAPPANLQGSDPACTMQLTDTPAYGVAPVPVAREAQFEYTSLGRHQLTWSGSGSKTFQTCPPKRILFIGDSISFTLGVPMLDDEQRYGVEVADAANLGCAFATRGELNLNGNWERPEAGCRDALGTWAADVRSFQPDEVVVEMGYRDEFDWMWNGQSEHLGDRSFDDYEQAQIERYVDVLGRSGTKILFLTVPFTHPPDQADGSPAPAASPSRHAVINRLLMQAAARHPGQVGFLDIDRTISPGNHYNGRLDGQTCRFDGIHFSVFCGKLLEPKILASARALLRAPAGHS